MIEIAVYQHRVFNQKALVTGRAGKWVEFYRENSLELAYLEEDVFEQAYQLFSPLNKPLYTEEELAVLREQAKKNQILVPREFG
jgi:hypothetical protein